MKIKEAKIVKVGNSFYVTVPKQYINNGIIDPNQRYDVQLVESKITIKNSKGL